MAENNADQIEYWNSDSGGKWVRNQERMDRTLNPFSDHVMTLAAVQPDERVLDVGCGTGATTIKLADQGARVTGVDVSRPMLAHAAARPDAGKARFVEADASAHDFGDGVFDLVFSRFGVMFFADPDAAFANLGRMLSSDGRVAFACWRPLSENPWMLKPVLVAKDFIDLPPRPAPEDPGPFSFANPERVTRILTAGGFSDISIQPFDHDMYMGDTVEDSVVTAMEVGPIGGVAKDADPAIVTKLEQALADMLGGHMTSEGVRLPGAIWAVTARKA